MKNKLIFVIAFYIILCFCSCLEKKIDYTQIDSIEVYHIPFGINFPTPIGGDIFNDVSPYTIYNDRDIKEIIHLLEKLEESPEDELASDIYLGCIFHFKDGSSVKLVHDKRVIDINGIIYKNSESLMKKIVSLKPD